MDEPDRTLSEFMDTLDAADDFLHAAGKFLSRCSAALVGAWHIDESRQLIGKPDGGAPVYSYATVVTARLLPAWNIPRPARVTSASRVTKLLWVAAKPANLIAVLYTRRPEFLIHTIFVSANALPRA